MKRFLTICSVAAILAVATTANAQQRYGWVVSRSATDPCVHWGNFLPGIVTLHLWYAYNSPDGLSAADISVVVNPPGALNIFGFNVVNGFLNAGDSTNLLLAVGGCPNGSIVVGNWIVQSNVPNWELCLGGNNLSVNCGLDPSAHPHDYLGYSNNVPPSPMCCGNFSNSFLNCEGCGTVSVEDASWGDIKSLYR